MRPKARKPVRRAIGFASERDVIRNVCQIAFRYAPSLRFGVIDFPSMEIVITLAAAPRISRELAASTQVAEADPRSPSCEDVVAFLMIGRPACLIGVVIHQSYW